MSIEVVDWSPDWAEQLEQLAAVLRPAVAHLPGSLVPSSRP